MNEDEIKNFLSLKRHILAIAVGIFGGSLSNDKSNIHPYIIGALLSGFVVKMVYGDYDIGYQWSISDLLFWIITILEGIFGAFLINNLK
jgi:hypothetical protein